MPPDPTQPPESVLLQAWKGLRNTVSAERLGPDELVTARNVDLDDAGQPHRRRGYTRVAEGNWHSLFRSGRGIYAVRDGDLVKVRPGYTTQILASGLGPGPLAWCEVGPTLYFSSAVDSGKISAADVVTDWGAVGGDGTWLSPVVNPTATLNPVRGKQLGKPPMATAMCWLNGRIWMASGATLWATELYLYDFVDKTRNYLMFESDITVVGAVTDGMYVGTRSGVWFLTGTLAEMRRVPVLTAGAVPGSLVPAPPDLVSPQREHSRSAVLFLTTAGLCVGHDGGALDNLTETRVLLPDAERAAALFRRQDGVNQYIAVADSGGTPTTGARIGDFVDAEIRRFTGA